VSQVKSLLPPADYRTRGDIVLPSARARHLLIDFIQEQYALCSRLLRLPRAAQGAVILRWSHPGLNASHPDASIGVRKAMAGSRKDAGRASWPALRPSSRTSRTCAAGSFVAISLSVQPFSQKSRTQTVTTEFQIGLCGVVEADLELFCNCWSAGFLGERLYVSVSYETFR